MNSSATALRFIQLSDLHLRKDKDFTYHGTKPYASLQNMLRHIRESELAPDFLLLTGDLADDQEEEIYFYVDELLKPLEIPYYWLPGNHDHLVSMQSVSGRLSVQPQRSFELKGIQFILLNSVEPENQDSFGELIASELHFLEEELQKSVDKPCVIALHHPPVKVGCLVMDELMLREAEKFLEKLNAFPQSKTVIFGHIHAEFVWKENGLHFLSCPSTSLQFKIQDPFELDTLPPGFRFFEIGQDGMMHTQVFRIS